MAFQSMVDMAKTPDEVKKEVNDYPRASFASDLPAPKVPVYPYGLCISLDEDTLAKLKLDGDLPDVGEMIHLAAMAKVTSVSEREREDTTGNKTRCCRVELQITHLATEVEDQEEVSEARRGRFYGETNGAEA